MSDGDFNPDAHPPIRRGSKRMSAFTEIDSTPGVLRWMAYGCWLMAVAALLTVLTALIDPPDWNRVERLIHAWLWFYVGCLHVSLARARETP